MVAAVSLGCGSRPTPSLTSVEPATASKDRATELTVHGVDLWPQMTADFDHPFESTVDSVFVIGLDGPQQVVLGSPAWLASDRLNAVVPGGLTAGQYALTVKTPGGPALRLEVPVCSTPMMEWRT